MPIVLFDVGHTIIDDPFSSVIGIMRNTKYDFLHEILQRADLVEVFYDFWTDINLEKHIPFGSHFMQEEYWIMKGLYRLKKEFNLQIESSIPLIAPKILLSYRELAKENILKQPQISKYQIIFKWLKDSHFKLGIASDDREFASLSILEWAQLKTYLDYIFVSESLSERYPGSEKPNIQFYNAILNELKNDKDEYGEIIFVGDSERNDIVPANISGMITIKFINESDNSAKPQWLDRTEETIADYKYSNPDDLIGIFKQILKLD